MSSIKCNRIIDVVIFFSLVVIAGLAKVVYPSEIMWDLLNYHYYNPWAFFHDRLGYDIAPAMVNTYFNPLIDIPYYLMLTHWADMPTLIRFCQGAYYGILLFVFYKICLLFFDVKKEWLAIFITVLIAATGFASLSQAGTSSNEVQVSILILLGFYLIVKHISETQRKKTVWIYSGLLMGIALGLKPTVITYCMAMGISLILFMKSLKVSIKEIIIFALSGLVGYLIINGWWMWQLYIHFDNPFFPFLNKIFKSEYYDLINYRDDQYIIKTTWLQKLWLPILISFKSIHEKYVTVKYFFDLRFALAYVISFLIFINWLAKGRRLSNCRYLLLYVFIGFSYVIWVYLFSIIRYVIPIEMLSAIVIVKFFQKFKTKGLISYAFLQSLQIIGIYALISEVPDYNKAWSIRPKSLADKLIFMNSVELPSDVLIKTYGYPSAMSAALLVGNQNNKIINFANGGIGPNVEFVENTKIAQKRREIEMKHRGPIIALISHNSLDEDLFQKAEHNANIRADWLKKEGFVCRTFYSFDVMTVCITEKNKHILFNDKNNLFR